MDRIELAQRSDVEDRCHEQVRQSYNGRLPLPLREGVGGGGLRALASPPPPTPSRKGRGRFSVLLALLMPPLLPALYKDGTPHRAVRRSPLRRETSRRTRRPSRRCSEDGTGSRAGAHRGAEWTRRSSPDASVA